MAEDKKTPVIDDTDSSSERDEDKGKAIPDAQAQAADENQKRAETKATSSKAASTTPQPDSAGNIAADKSLTDTFLKLSGYKAGDVIGSNESRRSFVTSNGGKYIVTKSGKALRKLQGPDTPKQLKEATAEEEDE